jgi:hypothetical protein
MHPDNLGLIALAGVDGSPQATGALTGLMPPLGGAAGPSVFVDGDPLNDFWGVKRNAHGALVGESTKPIGGSGGGAGGDAAPTAVFPNPSWVTTSDEKGGSGGGGGGLGLLTAPVIVLGPAGAIRVDGGRGASGENTINFDRVGGGGGGGSGGWLVMQARLFDLSAASAKSITALGGKGAKGAADGVGGVGTNGGGHGGPGVIQLHTVDGTEAKILLPPGLTLDDVTVPRAHVLLPIL